MKKILIVGAGIAGCVLAERFASIGKKVILIDKRNHIAGNCYDYYMNGVLVHKYGPHRFRTNSKKVKKYLSKFTKWYSYKVSHKSYINGKYYTFPINMDTINQVFKTELITETECKKFVSFLLPTFKHNDINSEDYLINRIGKILYEMFYKSYTIKQWGIHPKELNASVCGRVPVYFDNSKAYVAGKEEIMPKDGFTAMFNKMIVHPNITIRLNQEANDLSSKDLLDIDLIIWTGRIDEFYEYKFGKLPHRSLEFKFREYREEYHQKWYKIAYPTLDVDQTRDIEFKYLTKQKCPNTVVMSEFPKSTGDPFYPIPTKENKELYEKYKKEAIKEKKVVFIGRLAQYEYLDMDVCVERALDKFEELKNGK